MTATILAGMLLCGCTAKPASTASVTPVFPAAVTLTSSAGLQATGITIGVLTGPFDGEGSDYREMASGACVAAFRFGLGGLTVTLTTVADDGTLAGTASSMQTLIDAGVAGVVVADAGPHLQDAISEAVAANIPTLLPYDYSVPATAPAYHTGPDASMVGGALKAAAAAAGMAPIAVVQPGYETVAAWTQTTQWDGDAGSTAQAVVQAVSDGQADEVVIEAPAITQAALVSQLQVQLGNQQLPIILTPQALTPTFNDGLTQTGAAPVALMTIGQNTSDAVALQPDTNGDAMSAYLQSVRMAADSPTTTNVFGDNSFASASGGADTASHDAVVTLVRAAEKAGSTNPSAIASALAALSLTQSDGLAGNPLNFNSKTPLDPNAVVTLFASSQNAGLRPAGSDTALTWVPMST